jgi:allantoicase
VCRVQRNTTLYFLVLLKVPPVFKFYFQNFVVGWETARHPNRPGILAMKQGSTLLDIPLSDWAVLKLGKEAANGVARAIIDTKHFRGNFPESAMLEGCYDPEESKNEADPPKPHVARCRTCI